jgi:TusA-related sulfurtransferase
MKIDACGLSCPQPVLLTMKAMKDNGFPLQILVDSKIACENVQRLAENKGCQVAVEKFDDKIQITLTK